MGNERTTASNKINSQNKRKMIQSYSRLGRPKEKKRENI